METFIASGGAHLNSSSLSRAGCAEAGGRAGGGMWLDSSPVRRWGWLLRDTHSVRSYFFKEAVSNSSLVCSPSAAALWAEGTKLASKPGLRWVLQTRENCLPEPPHGWALSVRVEAPVGNCFPQSLFLLSVGEAVKGWLGPR